MAAHKSGVRMCYLFCLLQLGFLHDRFLVPILQGHAAPRAIAPQSSTPSRPQKKERKENKERKQGEGKRGRKERKERKLEEQSKDKGNVNSHG